jgi:hypothetical protein
MRGLRKGVEVVLNHVVPAYEENEEQENSEAA